jgi:hypothetical protein
MPDVQEALARLRQSKFRSQIHLQQKERDYFRQKGMDEVLKHAAGFVEKRLAPASPTNDGKQTPWHNHPVFVAQHATATCCRGCMQKWHQIPKGRELTEEEQRVHGRSDWRLAGTRGSILPIEKKPHSNKSTDPVRTGLSAQYGCRALSIAPISGLLKKYWRGF